VERALAAAAPDRTVPAVALRGGQTAARAALRAFLRDGLPRYGEGRNHPDDDASSGLSPWLHFGHVSAHEVRAAVVRADAPGREAFLDQLVTWRELGFAAAARDPGNHARYEGLPAWSRATLEEHADDRREAVYAIEDLAASRTDDPVWNAAQRQLVREGRMHNYLRMLWGKRVLSWTASPREAFDTLVELNDRYALDGRDPNSYTGISWCLGKYDRAWGPERPVFGKVRYMSTASTLKKLRMKQYLRRYGPAP
jgi:deoxyribodipyrimidine photo-lyase